MTPEAGRPAELGAVPNDRPLGEKPDDQEAAEPSESFNPPEGRRPPSRKPAQGASVGPPAAQSGALLDEACKAMSRGWALTPLDGKRPILKGWQQLPKPSRREIEVWIAAGRNLGLRTGNTSGVVVIDDDTDGSAEGDLGLPPTVTVITGSGKRHYYFRASNEAIPNSASRILPRVDVRGDGGQVVYPGSVHPDTGEAYRWLVGHSPEEIDLAELPVHLLERLQGKSAAVPSAPDIPSSPPLRSPSPPPRPPPRPRPRPRPPITPALYQYIQAALKKSLARIVVAPEGKRNDTLNRAAFALGRYVAAQLLDRGDVETKLLDAATMCGLPRPEALATVASGLDAGAANPADIQQLEAKLARGRARKRRSTTQAPPERGAPPTPGNTSSDDDDREHILFHDCGNDTPLHLIVPRAAAALGRRCSDELYVRAGMLVRVVRAVARQTRGVAYAFGLRIREVRIASLRQALDRAAAWTAMRETKEGAVRVEEWAPQPVVSAVRELGDWPGLDPLEGVLEAPGLRPDGSVLDTPGYDPSTGLIYAPCRDYPGIPDAPTEDDVRHAWDVLLTPFQEFALQSAADKSSLAALMLTIAGRHAIEGPVPHWLVSAPTFGSGKTLLAEAVSIAMAGVAPDMMAPVGGRPADADAEMRKRLTSVILEAPRVAVIDNLPDGATFESKAFAALLTTEVWSDRLLGKNQTVRMLHRIVWISTGCNCCLWGDLARRSLSIAIDPRVEAPHLRRFAIEDLTGYVRNQHPLLLTAALTILQAFVRAGSPRHSHAPLGKFEAWDRLVRGAVIWATGLLGGAVDPVETAARLQEDSPDRSGLAELLLRWDETYQSGTQLSVRKIIADASKNVELAEAIVSVGGVDMKGRPDGRAFGNRLRVLAGRIVGGKCLRNTGTRQNAARWTLEYVGGGQGGESGESSWESLSSRAPAQAPARGGSEPNGLTSPTGLTQARAEDAGSEPVAGTPNEEAFAHPEPEQTDHEDDYAIQERLAIEAEGALPRSDSSDAAEGSPPEEPR